MDYQWCQLVGSKYRFQTDSFSQNSFGKRFTRLNHEHMLVSVANFGGPIAITSDKKKILTLREDDPSIDNICIFSNEGEIKHRIKLTNPFQNVIVLMQFLKDEYLLVIFQKGQLWIVDPFSAQIKKFNLVGLLEGQTVNEGKVFDNGFVIFTSMKRFLFVRNAFQPQCIEFTSCEQQFKELRETDGEQKLFWTVFAPKLTISQKVELHLAHPTAGIIQIVENQAKRYFLNQQKGGHVVESKLPHIKCIKYISNLSPNKKLIAYFSAEPLYKQNPMDQIANLPKNQKKPAAPRIPYGFAYRLIIAPSINSDTIDSSKFKYIELPFVKDGSHLNNKNNEQKLEIKWCGNKAVIVQFQNHELYLCAIQGDFVRIEKDRGQREKWSFLKEEKDGTRIISKKDNKIIRQIPTAYVSVFQAFSQQPGALLYAAYEAFQDQQPLQDDQIRKDKDRLAVGVEQCIRSSQFELKYQKVIKLMKSATYGKAFLPHDKIENNSIYETSKYLRVVNHLRQKLRYITVEQFQSLEDDEILTMLLRNREHYLAFQIYNYLKKDQSFRVKIFTDWACCKVQNREESEEYICQQIKEKLENEKGVSFTQIAHKSIEIGRSELAMRLLEFEPSLSKKVPLLLWIGNRQNLQTCHKFYQKGIQDALKSRDLNLLFLSIKKIISSQKLSDYEIFELFSKNREGVFALINYYKIFDPMALIKFYGFLQNGQSLIMEYIKRALADKKYENMQKLLFVAGQQLKSLQTDKNDWRKQTFRKLFDHFNQFVKFNSNIKYVNDKVKPLTLMKQLQGFVIKGDSDTVNDMMDSYKLPEKRAIMIKIKVLLDGGKWQDLIAYVEKYQKKYNIPVELLADILMHRKQTIWAMKMMARMPSKQMEEQYLLLQRIGRIREAIDLAFDRKDSDVLEQIQSTLLDPELKAYINQKLAILGRSRR